VSNPIEARSYEILASRVDLTRYPPPARALVARMVYASADESFASTARVGSRAVERALEALRTGAAVVCDSRMVAAGATGITSLAPLVCALDLATCHPLPGSTRSAEAVSAAARLHPDGALWVIGNAPTALARLMQLHRAGKLRPAVVVGLPVGYVGAAESKEELWRSALQPVAVTNIGVRGGSAVAAAVLNALARML
jgi:precorrin-8X/cobalt-precorrin-8 methylmutase